MATQSAIDWLLEGDPVIRWQAQRDLCDASESEWMSERQLTLTSGWGAQFIGALSPELEWPDGRWTGTVWSLLTVMDCGLPVSHPRLQAAAKKFIDKHLTSARASDQKWLLTRMDICHLGFWLRIGAYFIGNDNRLASLADTILRVQLADGGWNCRIRNYPKTIHSSFHTTFNILEGLRLAAEVGIVPRGLFRESEARALEFMAHRMYRSDKTGDVIDERFTHLTYPSHWHYNMLRGLDYMRLSPEIRDKRLDNPIATICGRRNQNGRWPVEKRIAGTELFSMERFGGESRWVTLKALRILKARYELIG